MIKLVYTFRSFNIYFVTWWDTVGDELPVYDNVSCLLLKTTNQVVGLSWSKGGRYYHESLSRGVGICE